ncbi:MAG: glycosyltransferase [Acidobacteriota bacterium]
MKVSVIIPLYNKAPYVRRALDSVSAQTFADFEVIVVDDGSTDDGPAIAGDYGNPRFRLIQQTNAGPGAARNAGIAQAKGELIAFLDADDEWLPEYLAESVRRLEQYGSSTASITSGYIEHPDQASTEPLWRKRGITDGVHRVRPDMSPSQVVSMLAYMSPCTTVVRAEVIRKWRGFHEDRCVFGEDAQLWLKVLLNETVAFNLRPLACFHREASGLSKNLKGVRPVEPFLNDAREVEDACPAALRDLLSRVLAIRAAKTACVLGYWGHWREARALVQKFTGARNWRLPYHLPAAVCSTPVGSALGTSWRATQKVFARHVDVDQTSHFNGNGHKSKALTALGQHSATLKLVCLVEATNINAVAKNVLEFYRAARELNGKSADVVPIELSVVTFDRAGSSAEFVEAARGLGLEVDVISERGRFDRSVLGALRTIINRRRPDIVVTHQVKSHFLVRLSGLHRKYPWVAFNHGYTTTDRKMQLYNRLDRNSLPHADRVVTVCAAFARELESKGIRGHRISVLHNSIQPEPQATEAKAAELRTHLGIKADENVILAVGRLSKEKAQIDLLNAFSELRRTNPSLKVRLIIAGDGPEREQLEAAASSLGIADQVVFAGQIADMQPYYAIADLLVNASHTEGSPYVLLEAMAAGVPIVATAVGGVPEILSDGETGLLVPPRDPPATSATIEKILNDSALARKLSNSARALISTRFAPEIYVQNLVEIYRNVLSERANR